MTEAKAIVLQQKKLRTKAASANFGSTPKENQVETPLKGSILIRDITTLPQESILRLLIRSKRIQLQAAFRTLIFHRLCSWYKCLVQSIKRQIRFIHSKRMIKLTRLTQLQRTPPSKRTTRRITHRKGPFDHSEGPLDQPTLSWRKARKRAYVALMAVGKKPPAASHNHAAEWHVEIRERLWSPPEKPDLAWLRARQNDTREARLGGHNPPIRAAQRENENIESATRDLFHLTTRDNQE